LIKSLAASLRGSDYEATIYTGPAFVPRYVKELTILYTPEESRYLEGDNV
jgi:hypothetical protein